MNEVVVYTKPNCGGCIGTKRHLDRLGIPWSEAPIEDIHALAVEQGISAAPVVVAGEQMWGGYRPDRIDALIS